MDALLIEVSILDNSNASFTECGKKKLKMARLPRITATWLALTNDLVGVVCQLSQMAMQSCLPA
jgi:hypothetical protein